MADPKATLIIQLKDFASKNLTKIGGRLQKIARDAEKAKFIFGGLAAAIGVIGLAALKTAGDFEQWRVAFTTMLGSADKADLLLKKIRDFALKTPFDLPQVVEGTKRLLAFGIAAADLIPTMKVLGDISAGVSVPIGRLTTVFGQVRAAGRLMGQEVLQFTNAGVPILELLAIKAEKSQAEIKKLGEQGQISFEMVREVLFEATEEGGKFFNLMEAQNKTLLGSLAELADEITEVKKAIGDALLPTAKDLVQMAIQVSRAFGLWIQENRALAVIALTVVGGFSALMVIIGGLTFIMGPLIAAFSVTITVLGQILLPIGLIISAIAVWKTNFADLGTISSRVFKEIRSDLAVLAAAFLLAATGNFRAAFLVIEKVGNRVSESVAEGFKDAADNLKKEWQGVKDFFDKSKLKAVAGVTLGESEFGDDDRGRISKLTAEANKEIELALNTAEQRKIIKAQELAAELEALGQHEKAKELLEAAFRKSRIGAAKGALTALTTLQKSKSKELAAVGKAAAISQATIDTFVSAGGAARALSGIPVVGPALALAAVAAFTAAGLARVAAIQGTPLAAGGVVLPTAGGTQTIIGEAGSREAVLPLDDEEAIEGIRGALGGGGVSLNVGVLVASDDGITELAHMLDEKFFHFDRTNQRAS